MKTKKIFLLFLLSIVVLFTSCDLDDDFEKGVFPSAPVNFEAVNSVYDDYNSASPYELYYEFLFVFSSNRNSQGENFDLVSYIAYYHYNTSSNQFYMDVYEGSYGLYDTALAQINTEFNEYGPSIIYAPDYVTRLFFYASDKSGDLDIYYLKNEISDDAWENPVLLDKINSSFNEAYPAFNQEISELYFCSDSSGDFDIYNVGISSSSSLISWIESDIAPSWNPNDVLNSNADDKCPYINGDLMVFTSNRDGGYGGYDLYYSVYDNNAWSTPVNFGPEINSEFDEYRPITMYAYNYKNDLMIFSSNRAGGKGGFDLYYVGIPKMIY